MTTQPDVSSVADASVVHARGRLEPGKLTAPGRDLALDGLRGLCAVLVLFSHAFTPGALDPGFASAGLFFRLNLGFAGVLLFFLISGYAIGLAVRSPMGPGDVSYYLRRRFWRLVPINTAAVLLSWLALPTTDADAILGNLLFLQNRELSYAGWQVPLLTNNTNLWTLHFEVVYYLLFLAVWKWPCRATVLFGGLLLVTVSGGFAEGFPHAIARYACGGLYWFCGLWVAWCVPTTSRAAVAPWPSALLCAAAIWSLSPLRGYLYVGGFDAMLWPTPVSPHRLDFLPAGLWLLLAVTGRSETWQRRLAVGCLAWGATAWVIRAVAGSLGDVEIFAGVAMGMSIALWKWRPEPTALRRMAGLGAISFAVYAVGAPIQSVIVQWNGLPAGAPWGFAVRLIVLMAATFSVAWRLERRAWPWLLSRVKDRQMPAPRA